MTDAVEPILDVAHLGHVELFSPKPDQSLWYFRDVLGMEEVHREGQSAYLRGYGDYTKFSLKLTERDRPGVGRIGWRVVSPQALERRAASLEEAGAGLGWSNGDHGIGRTFSFVDPDGHEMDVYYEMERYEAPDELRSSLRNRPQRFTGRGVGVTRTDHVALLCGDVTRSRNFMERHMGFKLREQVLFDDGKSEIGSWMSVTPIHHDLAYVRDIKVNPGGRSGRLHHYSMWVDGRSDVLRAAEILRENDIFIEAGPSKHNLSQAFYLYSWEPGGNRVEMYTSSFWIFAPDWKPVYWNEEQRGTGVHWGGALPESFLNYATPETPTDPGAAQTVPDFDPL